MLHRSRLATPSLRVHSEVLFTELFLLTMVTVRVMILWASRQAVSFRVGLQSDRRRSHCGPPQHGGGPEAGGGT